MQLHFSNSRDDVVHDVAFTRPLLLFAAVASYPLVIENVCSEESSELVRANPDRAGCGGRAPSS